jgi:hypothetical protein
MHLFCYHKNDRLQQRWTLDREINKEIWTLILSKRTYIQSLIKTRGVVHKLRHKYFLALKSKVLTIPMAISSKMKHQHQIATIILNE